MQTVRILFFRLHNLVYVLIHRIKDEATEDIQPKYYQNKRSLPVLPSHLPNETGSNDMVVPMLLSERKQHNVIQYNSSFNSSQWKTS